MAPRQKAQAVGITASAARIDISDKKIKLRAAENWQHECYQYANSVPELKQSVNYVGNQMSKLRLIVAWKESESAVPVDIHAEELNLSPTLIAQCDAELARLKGETGGTSDIIKRAARALDIAGECYLVGFEEDPIGGTPEEWRICSIREIEKKGATWRITDDPADRKGRALNPDTSTVIRIWEKDDEYAALATSTIKGVLGEARILQILSQQVQAMSLRAANNGFFVIPNDLSFGPANPVEPEDGEEATADPTMDAVESVFLGPIEDPADPNSVQPALIRGDKESLKPDYLRHITFWSKEQDDALEAKINQRVQRIARGVNLPLEVVMGHQGTTFANASAINESEFDDFMQPRSVTLVDGLTIGFLRPNLLDTGVDAETVGKLVVWYDPEDLIKQPDQEANADAAHANFTISDSAYRKAKGFNEEDAPDPLEVVVRAGLKRGIFTAQITQALIQPKADEAGVPLPSQEELMPGGPPVDGDAGAAARAEWAALVELVLGMTRQAPPEPAPLALVATSGAAYGRRLAAIDRDLRTRLTVAANDAMTRALDKAGAKMRSRAGVDRALVKNVPNRLVAATLGPSKVHAFITTDEALDGAWDELEAQFYAWGRASQADALETASVVAGGFTVAQRDQYKLRQAADLDEAWLWLKQSLTALAGEKLFDPSAGVLEAGEFDPSAKVPTGLLRQAIARAGGGAGLTTNGQGGAFITLTDAGRRPAGGIGTGELLREAMRDHGVQVEAYVWEYGPAYRKAPFEPHASLDGQVFENFDDGVLANVSGFPDVPYYMPGDHQGCCCDCSPVLIPVEESTGRAVVVNDDEAGAA